MITLAISSNRLPKVSLTLLEFIEIISFQVTIKLYVPYIRDSK